MAKSELSSEEAHTQASPGFEAVPGPTTGPSVARGDLGGPVVVLSDVDKHFGELYVLQKINLTVRKGEVVVVLGPSGSGKSTLCRVINRLETIESGTITIDGQPLPLEGKALAQLRADVGMIVSIVQSLRPQDRLGERHAWSDQGTQNARRGGQEARHGAAKASWSRFTG